LRAEIERMTVYENLRIGINASKNSTLALIFLAVLKGIVGFYSGSTALIADAVHTSLDIFTSLAVWAGFRLSLEESGEKFPYGFYKAENLVALFVSIIILFSGMELIREALVNLRNPVKPELPGIALGAAIFSVFAIYMLSRYKIRVGRQINSQALTADAVHSYMDVFSTVVVVVALVGSFLGIYWLDSIGVLIISVIIFRFGIMTAKDSILILMDAWLDKDSINRIRQEIGDIPGVNLVEDIKLRKSGLVVFGEVAVEIEGEANLKRVEMLSEEIEMTVKKEVKNLEHVVINAKPAKMDVMKIAFPIETQNGLQSTISWHFGKAPYYIFIELNKGKTTGWEIIENLASGLDKKKGVKTAYFLIDKNINILITKDIGEGPFHILHDNFVKILQMPADAGCVEEVIEKISELSKIIAPSE
jgi:cation diffusion facilitator family transporter